MEKKYNIKKIIISVVLIALIVIPFALVPCGAVNVHGRNDYSQVCVPMELWLQNANNVYIGTDFKLVNYNGNFPNADFYVEYNDASTAGQINTVAIPYATDTNNLNGVNYNTVGFNVNYTTETKYLRNYYSSVVIDNVGTYSYDVYEYDIKAYAKYKDGNLVRTWTQGEDIKAFKMRGGGFAINAGAMQSTTEDDRSLFNSVVLVDSANNGIVNVDHTILFRDIVGNHYNITVTYQIEATDNIFYYVNAIDYNMILNAINERDDLSHDNINRYLIYVDSYETYVYWQDYSSAPLGTFKVYTNYVSGPHSSIMETNHYFEEFDDYVYALKAWNQDGFTEARFVEWLSDCLSGVFSINLAYGITFGGILAVIIGFSLLMWFLKNFGGG